MNENYELTTQETEEVEVVEQTDGVSGVVKGAALGSIITLAVIVSGKKLKNYLQERRRLKDIADCLDLEDEIDDVESEVVESEEQ